MDTKPTKTEAARFVKAFADANENLDLGLEYLIDALQDVVTIWERVSWSPELPALYDKALIVLRERDLERLKL